MPMTEDDLFALMDSVLHPLGATSAPGDGSRTPPLDVLAYYARAIRLSPIPILGRGLSIVAVCRQPIDVGISKNGYRSLIERLAIVVNTRFPPVLRGRGLTLGLTAVVITPEPVQPDDDAALSQALDPVRRTRAVPLGVFRINLGQEALSFSLKRGPEGLFPEPELLADAFATKLRRFVPLVEMG
jgi:hypothetical protein